MNVHIPMIYAPRLAAALIRNKLEEHKLKEPVRMMEYNKDTHLSIGQFNISFFTVTHSIPDSFGICFDTGEGRIVTTGDLKIDLTPVGEDIELYKMAKLGEEGVDLLLSDSTNVEIEGYTPSEKAVIASINEIFATAPGRLIISTFSSNISRIQQIVEAAVRYQKKITIVGRSMENVVSTSRQFGYIKIPDSSLVELDNLNSIRFEETVILCTGSQGEPLAALARIAKGDHQKLRIFPGDTVVFSSSVIPGNGDSINRVVNALTRAGANVLRNSVLNNIHSSGHASKQELRFVLKLLKPKYFMPVHGEYRMLKVHNELAQTLGILEDHIFIMTNGDSIILKNHNIKKGERVVADDIYIDGKDINGLSAAVLKDRKILSSDGAVEVLVSIDSSKNLLLKQPHIYTQGFALDKQNKLVSGLEAKLNTDLETLLKKRVTFLELKNLIRNTTSAYLHEKTERNPMIIPVIMDASAGKN
jgi:ribonuclease J